MFKIIIIILFIIYLNYICYKNGNYFYNETHYKRHKVFDLCYYYLPRLKLDYTISTIFHWLLILLPFIPFLFPKNENNLDILKEVIELLLPILLIRGFTINLTVLPSDQKCNTEKISFNEIIHGHCYDKQFSGHLAIVLTFLYVFWKHNIISIEYYVINVLIVIFYMLLTRGHYTNDLIFSFFVVYFSINENLKIKF